jgi:hypothetical protein
MLCPANVLGYLRTIRLLQTGGALQLLKCLGQIGSSIASLKRETLRRREGIWLTP